ncbi:hypothetical protein G6F32_015239 [Rhizopus arrhizus]|nr:hypothetical protein G6F32_015239 [Rhizopus arrhizus]
MGARWRSQGRRRASTRRRPDQCRPAPQQSGQIQGAAFRADARRRRAGGASGGICCTDRIAGRKTRFAQPWRRRVRHLPAGQKRPGHCRQQLARTGDLRRRGLSVPALLPRLRHPRLRGTLRVGHGQP